MVYLLPQEIHIQLRVFQQLQHTMLKLELVVDQEMLEQLEMQFQQMELAQAIMVFCLQLQFLT